MKANGRRVFLSEPLLSSWKEIHKRPSSSQQHHSAFKTKMSGNEASPVEVPRWSMYPSLHTTISHALKEDALHYNFHSLDDPQNSIREYDTNIKGRFHCINTQCPQPGWGSKRIPITIRMYRDFEYNARVYHQRCKSCNKLSWPVLDSSYVERVVYRIKKWNGLEMVRPAYFGNDNRKPHNSESCEGCRAGRCREGVDDL